MVVGGENFASRWRFAREKGAHEGSNIASILFHNQGTTKICEKKTRNCGSLAFNILHRLFWGELRNFNDFKPTFLEKFNAFQPIFGMLKKITHTPSF